MNRFEVTHKKINELYETIQDPMNRHLCILHHKRVLERVKNKSDNELLYVAAFLHDCGLYLGLPGKHALSGSKFARSFLSDLHLYSEEEIEKIVDLIALHSEKEKVHYPEAELLKQADISAHSLSDL